MQLATGRGCLTGDTDLDLDVCEWQKEEYEYSVGKDSCPTYVQPKCVSGCTLDRGSLLGNITPSLARSFFSSSSSTSSCRECWGICCACEPDGQNITIKVSHWVAYPNKALLLSYSHSRAVCHKKISRTRRSYRYLILYLF